MDRVNISQEQFSQLQLHNGISWGSFKKVDSWVPLSKMLMAMLWCLPDALKALHLTHSRGWKLPLLWFQWRTTFTESPFIIHLSTSWPNDSPFQITEFQGPSLCPASCAVPPTCLERGNPEGNALGSCCYQRPISEIRLGPSLNSGLFFPVQGFLFYSTRWPDFPCYKRTCLECAELPASVCTFFTRMLSTKRAERHLWKSEDRRTA